MTIGSIRRQESNHRPAFAPALALVLAGLFAILWPLPGALAQPCEPQWAEGLFGVNGVSGEVFAMAVFDDGSGPTLYVGGDFTSAGGVPGTSKIARWDGSAWSSLGGALNDRVSALTVFDDGSGPALYAGGSFTTAGGESANRIARWDGAVWTPMGHGLTGSVFALAVFDDDSGPALYAGGTANRIARWDGSEWTNLGGSMDSTVNTLTVFDDGSGPALYAGGRFTTAGGVEANRIARWDGSAWTPLGTGVSAVRAQVHALTAFDDGSGPALYAGGEFSTAGGMSASNIARWDGTTWTPLGSGVSSWVYALEVFDDGSGLGLFTGGRFTSAGDKTSGYIARWGCITEPCRADLDGDGQLTIFDFLLFQNLFAAGDLRADFDGDGELTFFDFLAFQNEFAAGCD